jgi:hypothetical protein
MSLVITSNTSQENSPEFSNAFKPFSYQNRLLNTMRIPPNSEIALQSAKINKNGLFVLDRSNADFCHYFGTPIGDHLALVGTEIPDLSESTTQPFKGQIGAGEAFAAGGKNERNVDDMADDLQKGFNKCAFHPSLINGDDDSFIDVSASYDATTNSFKGFLIETTQSTAVTQVLAKDIVWTDISKNNASTGFSQNLGVVTSTDKGGFFVQNRQYPLSQNKGHAIFDINSAGAGGWMVGLSRINKPLDIGAGDYAYYPNYFDFSRTTGQAASGRFRAGQFRYADICVANVGGSLKIFQSGARGASGGAGAPEVNGIFMNEVLYVGSWNTNFKTDYAVANEWSKVDFELSNEELSITLTKKSDGSKVLMADYTTLEAAGGAKNNVINPVNAAQWAMYPVAGADGAVPRIIGLDSIQHYTNYPAYTDTRYDDHDWWGWSQTNNETALCRELEQRPWNDAGSNVLLEPQGLTGQGMNGYQSLIITSKSQIYGDSTNECSSSRILGFEGQPVSIPTATTNTKTTNLSASVPKLISNISLFIRLNNFTQTSMNARKGTSSKIVAHLPRFDNSGNETGGLYFEPHEKTYLALNNPEEILINSFDVDFVYENEQLCTALSGKSIVCFHIRKEKM